MWQKLRQVWKTKELRADIIFVAAMLVVFRIAAHVPVPGVDTTALRTFFSQNQLFGVMNILSGGGMEQFSVVAMGVAPYITASIIFQLLAMIIPKLEEISKEGEQGRAKINKWTRWLTVPMAVLQGYGLIALLRTQAGAQIFGDVTPMRLMSILVTVTAGTMFLMWIGELISERKVGNGISLLIFAGIVAGLPSMLRDTIFVFDSSQLLNVILFGIVGIVTIVGVVIITDAQRNVPVSYAKQIRGMRMYGGANTHLPLRVNMAGVIPIIFAISIILFPPMLAQFFLTAKTAWVVATAQWVITTFQNQLIYGIMYFILVFGFTYFYTEIIFQPDQISENLQKQGGFIPGIRPGKPTAEYLRYITTRIIFAGALFLGLIAVLPLVVQRFTTITTLAIGGTSLLIVVSVVIETVEKIQSQLTMRDYEGL
jgi:preprotein translocase subunit SecY